ncbi:hypothetical protein QOT17_013201 [Balamuthia mandrillaris]
MEEVTLSAPNGSLLTRFTAPRQLQNSVGKKARETTKKKKGVHHGKAKPSEEANVEEEDELWFIPTAPIPDVPRNTIAVLPSHAVVGL